MREFLTTGLGIVAFVFTILGMVFTGVSLVLSAVAGQPAIRTTFLSAGGGFLVVGLGLTAIRLRTLRRRNWLLEMGQEARGTIVDVGVNPFVKLNGRRPWVVRYRYEVDGSEYQGREAMMDLPEDYKQGANVAVFYDPARVETSVLHREK